MFKYSKWIGYEFASNFERENFPTVKFPNGLWEGTVSGYLMDIQKPHDTTQYIVELRYKNGNYEDETQVIRCTFDCFRRTFYNATVLPK